MTVPNTYYTDWDGKKVTVVEKNGRPMVWDVEGMSADDIPNNIKRDLFAKAAVFFKLCNHKHQAA